MEVTDKEIRESKINSVPKNTKDLYIKILKQLFASVSVIIGEYSPRLRRIIVNLLLLGNIFQNVQILLTTFLRVQIDLVDNSIYLKLYPVDTGKICS